jgi:GTP-binding protein HflX
VSAARRGERALLVGVSRGRGDRLALDEHLDELERLATTAGAAVAGRLVQERGPVSAATLLRKGKTEELKNLCVEHKAALVIFDEDLSPAQVRNLEKETEATVLDRSALILDIFARRARSREARTQVELAQLRYLLPRLTRQWTHLSRQAGGIGQRGVGETQLESDRRIIHRRIARLADELSTIEKERRERRKSRDGMPRAALVGYTNAGKSTVLNLLTGAGAFVEDRLFATLDPLVRRVGEDGRAAFLLIDTVGFIRKLPHHLVASFRSTLEEAADADLLVHVADASSAALADHLETTRETLAGLELGDRPTLLVLNKADELPSAALEQLQAEHPHALLVSALDPRDGVRLMAAIQERLAAGVVEETVSIPLRAAGVLARLASLVQVTGTRYSGEQVEVRFRSRPETRERVARLLASSEAPPGAVPVRAPRRAQ